MDDKFIFDILLTSGGIEKPDTLFPPRDVDDLIELLRAIEDSVYDILKKECLVYYLLKWHKDGREERLQIDRCIPPQFTALADAYWHLDAGVNIPRAVSILSDNRLNREYASKIIHAISICPTPAPLIVQYVRTAKPLLTAPQDVWTYTLALAESSLLEAWQFQGTFGEGEEIRAQLLEKLLEWSISPSPHAKALAILLSLPLSRFEEEFLHKYALKPPKSLSLQSIATLRDLICVRLIQSGRYADAVKADHQFAASTLNESKTHAAERRNMVKELYEALPRADRTLLDAELEGTDPLKPIVVQASVPPPKATPMKNGINGDASISMSLSQSWEEVPRTVPLPSLTNGRAPPPRTAGPLFGGPQLGASTSSAAAPLIPVSTTSVLSSSQSFPLSSLSSSTSAKPRMSLGSQKQPFFHGASTGSKSKPLQFDFQASTSTSSASRKPNAFYTPPVQQQQNGGQKRPFEDLAASTGSGKGLDIDHHEDEDADMEVDHATPKSGKPQQQHESEDEEEEPQPEQRRQRERELGFSIFGNGPTAPKPPLPKKSSRSSRLSVAAAPAPPEPKLSRRAPPGAFHVSDDEGEEEQEEEEPISAPAPAPERISARTRRSTRTTTTAAAEPHSKTKRNTREEEADLGRSLPGSLMDEDRDEEEEEYDEAEDRVAPLREPSPPPRRARLPARRSTTPSDFADEDGEAGVKTRRRSSRLSTAGSPPQRRAAELKPEKGEKASASATKVRKSTRAAGSATKKKR
ncbi:hypothetical protein DXG03_004317 [Asterophora parasitica]|uniref:ELYS-like domain-containing protein n=1 Tax=Asterophora parasitica TaxID=117018 RepID=A0A9P7K7X0_9AGAR|nr:hypothetical protein DXG03_004317 [Asterophora parasitica]